MASHFAFGGRELSTTGGTVGELLNAAMDPTISYDDLDVIRGMWPGKIVIKGVQNVADATRLVDQGVDGIVLSTTAAASSTAHPSPSTCCRRSCARWARTPRSRSTPAS